MKTKRSYSTLDIRVRAVDACMKGIPVSQVADSYQIDRSTVHRWMQRKNDGNVGLHRSRAPGSGRPRRLVEAGPDKLLKIIRKGASKFGYETDLWTCRRIVQVLRDKFGTRVSRQTVWRRLREAGLTYQKPERRYLQASEKERTQWRRRELPKIRACVRKYKAILYFEDEANISLTAVVGKTWAPRGETPIATVTGKRGGVAAMSAVSKEGRLVFRLLEKRINSDDVIDFLEQVLAHHKRRHVVVVMDQAPPHTSNKTRDFIQLQRRLHVFYLPKYSPDWNPDEKIWNHLKHQELKDHQANTKSELKRLALRKLLKMQRNPSQIRGIFFRCCVADLLD
jgi:transposase